MFTGLAFVAVVVLLFGGIGASPMAPWLKFIVSGVLMIPVMLVVKRVEEAYHKR
jgi:ABC-type Fe3+-siderophore transport system permease subunit